MAMHAGIDLDAAARTSRGVLRRIASELDPALRGRLIDELPPQLAAAVADRDVGVAHPIEAYARVDGLTAGEAREIAAAVCRTIAEAMSAPLVRALGDALPGIEAFAAVAAEPIAPAHPIAHGHTLADGAPGATHPVGSRDPQRGQRASVASSDNPHGDAKLSSGDGTTQEREHETLAEGRAGSSRPMSGR